MQICFIADSSSIHVQRIVKHHVQRNDGILILSSALTNSPIVGAKVVQLLTPAKPLSNPINRAEVSNSSIAALLKSYIPSSFTSVAKSTKHALRLLGKRHLCLEEIRRFNPDVIYCFRSFPEGILALACGVRKLLLRTAGPDISKYTKYPVFRQIIRKALQKADIVVTESRWERELLRRLCGSMLDPKVIIIGLDSSLFHPPVSRESLRERYGLARNAFVVVTNRYLDGHYNGWLVVKAVESILQNCPNLILFYLTPGNMDVSTKRRAEAIMRRFPQIRFLEGPVGHSEMPNILGCGDVYVSFSSYDGIPNSVLEAMACGLVPIVADLPQLREWIEHGVDGYIVAQHHTNRLASLLSHLYQDRQALPAMSALCVEKIQTRASYDDCSKQTRKVLQQLARTDGYISEKAI
jgi:glycosyltransferase involved in cell wall biosynthesis